MNYSMMMRPMRQQILEIALTSRNKKLGKSNPNGRSSLPFSAAIH